MHTPVNTHEYSAFVCWDLATPATETSASGATEHAEVQLLLGKVYLQHPHLDFHADMALLHKGLLAKSFAFSGF